MTDILEEIVAWKHREIELMKAQMPGSSMRRIIEDQTFYKRPGMKNALKESQTGIIAEFKRKSPSRGWINEDARATDIPFSYQQHGATAVSILTDDRYFGGRDEFVKDARRTGVRIPILYKNFVIDEYQLLQARLSGVSSVLLIAACLDMRTCQTLIRQAHELGLEVLLEIHSEDELDYAGLPTDLIGVNNRNLDTFETNVNTSFGLIEQLPAEAIKISESGISDPSIVRELRDAGYRGFLIGESFMKTRDPGQALENFIEQL